MNIKTLLPTVLTLVGFVSLAPAAEAGQYYLRVAEIEVASAPDGKVAPSRVTRSLEGGVASGEPFFIKSVIDNRQWLAVGRLTETADGLRVEYHISAADLGDAPPPRTEFTGEKTVTVGAEMVLAPARRAGGTKVTLTIERFVPNTGRRGKSSGFSVRLIDAAGQPVVGAVTGLMLREGDEEAEPLFGPVKSDGAGLVRYSEGRDFLPTLTFVAELPDGKLAGRAHLDRDQVSPFDAAEPQPVTLREPLNLAPSVAKPAQ